MNIIRSIRPLRHAALVAFAASICLDFNAYGQATRTWVSGVGDDANPGSRTAPCKTFSGVITKTAAGGEISVLDPGGFGSIVITKSITINGEGTLAGINAPGSTGIIVNAGVNDVVTLRNLSINGTTGNTPGLYGIRILSAGVVRIENCAIHGGSTNGIDVSPSASQTLVFIHNSHIHDFAGSGVFVNPTGTGTAKVAIIKSAIDRCGVGISSAGEVTISGSTVTGNLGAGLFTSGGGSIKTFHDNRIFWNNPDGNPTGSLPLR